MNKSKDSYLYAFLLVAITYASVVLLGWLTTRSFATVLFTRNGFSDSMRTLESARDAVASALLARHHGPTAAAVLGPDGSAEAKDAGRATLADLDRLSADVREATDRALADLSWPALSVLTRVEAHMAPAVGRSRRSLRSTGEAAARLFDEPPTSQARVFLTEISAALDVATADFQAVIVAIDEVMARQLYAFPTYFAFLIVILVSAVAFGFGLRREIERRKTMEARAAAMAHALIAKKDDDDKRLSRELHDSIAQELCAARMDLESGKIARATGQIEKTIALVRAISHDLYSFDVSRDSLEGALNELVHAACERTNTSFSLVTRGLERVRLRRRAAQHVYQIARECVLNVVRHARASSCAISLTASNPYLILKCTDDGVGFDPTALSEHKSEGHIGVTSIVERARSLGGSATISSKRDRGTTVFARIPAESHK